MMHRVSHRLLQGAALVASCLAMTSCATPRPSIEPHRDSVVDTVAPIQAPTATPLPMPTSTPVTAVSLDEAIALTLQRNPDVAMAAARIEEAEARVREATSAFFPQVGARISYARTDNPAQAFGMILSQRRFAPTIDFNDPGTQQNVRPELVGAVPLFRGGADLRRRQAATLGADAARQQLLAVRNALTEATVTTYYALNAAPEQVAAARASVDAVTGALSQTRARVATGTALRADELSLEVRLAEAKASLLQAENGVELARAGLRSLLALGAEAPVEIEPPRDDEPTRERPTFAAALAQANARRPELVAAARQIEMRARQVQSEKAAYLPRIDAVASYGHDGEDLELSHHGDSWAVGLVAQMDLFSGFRTRSRVQAAETRLAQAKNEAARLQLDIEREVRVAHLHADEARRRAEVAEAAVAAANEALRLVRVQYDAGATSVTRYLEAEAAASGARARAIAARFEVRRSDAQLARATGTWAREEDQPK